MTGKTRLMAGAIAILAVAASAQAGSVSASASDNTAQAGVDDSNAALEQRIEALESELQASEMRQAAAANAQPAPAAPPPVMSGWWDNTSISGRMYLDFSNIDHKSNGVSLADEGTNFDVKRFYISVDHKFNEVFSADITTDLTYDSTTSASQIFVKKAYLQAKLDDALIIRAGSTDLPWIPFVEGLYGYRYVENTLIDRTKFGTSADWGLHVLGSLWDNHFSYAFSAINGAGYKKAPIGGGANRSNSIDVEGRVNVNFDDFVVGVGGYNGKLGHDITGATPTTHTANRIDAIAAYVTPQIRLGVEYFDANDWNNVTTLPSDSANGVSGFGSYKFTPQWGIFARYDNVKPNTKTNNLLNDNYYNVGITYSPVKIVDISLVYKHDQASHGVISTSNGNIGGSTNGVYNEIGVFADFQW
jgi:hypothetical protein